MNKSTIEPVLYTGVVLAGGFVLFLILTIISEESKQVKFRDALRQEQMLMQHELEMNELKLRNAALKEALENFNAKHLNLHSAH